MKKDRTLNRVDIQVSILVACAVFISSICVFAFCYYFTYKDMIKGLNDRVFSIYNFLETSLNKDSFESIETKEDMNTFLYQETKDMLENIRNTTGVMYLYTAKENSEGELIYVVDGLSPKEDFRYPGDKIEPEIIEDLRNALTGELILPNKIKSTNWGKIFITYLPIHHNNKIVGAVGIEFEAEHQFHTFRMLRLATPLILIGFCIIAIIIAIIIFKRISNPFYQDMANTDFATKLKNRNSFELDMNNWGQKKNLDNIGIISIDLNNLKKVNDIMGHSAGDSYILKVADIMRTTATPKMFLYRIGGDEFVVISPNTTEEQLSKYENNLHEKIADYKKMGEIELSLSTGSSMFDLEQDVTLFDTYKKADAKMYFNKKLYHKSILENELPERE